MFEKDIYQLIRGLRAHKGNEREYIQACLRECRQEIKSPDMDQKTTALLKLVYLEMFGHDMSWASFNVLEVMSSPKYVQKRVGYLSAVQSFRPDTEVLVLAENLLKKDLGSPDKLIISLPLISIPHVVSPSMANSLLTDLLPRLSHSYPAIRKKAIMTLYRLALVYPETLRPAWPKIKERLLDENEDPSVTAAIVNVVCELGWRRPQDFLPLAPRLFELLTDGTNNWMAIKIIKLFSVLTPLEPRLVKKLLPPLTNIIRTTPAMSLLYECINGIIQGGIMEAAGGTTEGDDVARLCVNKLRAMLVVEGDPNLRYVALLAFAKITSSHADLVSQHQDVILECIDDADISIRTRALDLLVGMINAQNLQTVVERLLEQLRSAGRMSAVDDVVNERTVSTGIIPMADDDEDEAQSNIVSNESRSGQSPPLPDDYRSLVIERILQVCSHDTYKNMLDFDWYIGILVELVKQCPATTTSGQFGTSSELGDSSEQISISDALGAELLNVAVRVKAVRPEAAAAAQSLLVLEHRDKLFPLGIDSGQGVLASAAFIAGEYARLLSDPEGVLLSMLHETSTKLPAAALKGYLQAIPKIFAFLTGDQQTAWNTTRKSQTELHIARIVHFLETLILHPNLEVQERAVEYLDLMRLAAEAVSTHQIGEDDSEYLEPPLLLTQAIPALFTGIELNPVAPTALQKVPQPDDLDLDTPINPNLQILLYQADYDSELDVGTNNVFKFYNEKPSAVASSLRRPAAELLEPEHTSRSVSYQDADEVTPIGLEQLEKRRADRRERHKDDPYYIDSERSGSGVSTPMHHILRSANGEEVDVDAIPVMELKLDPSDTAQEPHRQISVSKQSKRKVKKNFEITADESLGSPGDVSAQSFSSSFGSRPTLAVRGAGSAGKKSLLHLDSSGLSTLSLSDPTNAGTRASQLDIERRIAEEEEMAKAMKEVERLRLKMQRAQERIGIREDLPEDGVVVKRKKKKKPARIEAWSDEVEVGEGNAASDALEKGEKKKKKKKVAAGNKEEAPSTEAGVDVAVKAKRKKKKTRDVVFDGDE